MSEIEVIGNGTSVVSNTIGNGTPTVSNTWYLDKLGIKAMDDRVLILEDPFCSGYECKSCKGSGKEACYYCKGSGESTGAECFKCGGTGKLECIVCHGAGVIEGGLVIPEDAQRRPSTGKVISIGPKVNQFKIGDHVLYTNFAGTVVNLKQKSVLRFMREHEIMGQLFGEFANVQTYF